MGAFRSSALAKHPGNNLSSVFFSIVLLGLLPVWAAGDSCGAYTNLVLKPTSTYTRCDVKIRSTETKTAPTVALPTIDNATSVNLTTIIMLSPTGKNSVHWLKVNVSRNQLVLGISKRDDDVLSYRGPNPPEDTGEYIYEFYLLSQPRGGNVSIDPFVDSQRKNFKLKEFQNVNEMEVLGFFRYRTEFAYSSSERSSFPVILGIISLVLGVLFGG